MIPKKIKEVVDIFSNFPTVGERTATRFSLYLLSLPEEETKKICNAIENIKKEIILCSYCFNPFEAKEKEKTCNICSDKKREKTICVVEKETDLWQIEKTKKYKGVYFIIGEKMNFLKENSLGKMRVEELKKRIKNFNPKEIILAINPTSDGILTMNYINKILKIYNIKITRLGQGLPLGGEIEYADEETLSLSFDGRN